ncbi:MAG: hypothetical protein ACK2UK_14520, partial [Candidatus Promineifilaceae bacterium]
VSPADTAAVGLSQHYTLVTNLRRYDWWVFWNLLDLVIFSGWPLALGFGGACVLILRRWRDGRLSGVDALTISLVIIILALNLSGTARGEVGRLWLFFMPLLSFPAAFFWRSALPGRGSAAGIIGLQLLMLLCLGFAWQPVHAVIVVPEKPPMTAETPQSELNARFSGEPLTLQGYSLETTTSQSGGSLDLHLFWLAGGPASRPYTVFTHLQYTNGTIVAQQDNWPVNGTWPPTCWRSGDIIVDPYIIEIPPDTSPGSYELSTGLYDAASGERLRTVDGQDAVDLGTVQVISP